MQRQMRAVLSPVRGGRASPGLAAKHHLPAVLHVLHGVHDAAGLLGEDGALQDAALCRTTRKQHGLASDLCSSLFAKNSQLVSSGSRLMPL